jgi:predicted HNH restriction endonuclease
MKLAGYRCQRCQKKQSTAKGRKVLIECHHIDGVTVWDKILDLIYAELLVAPDKLVPLCRECHDAIPGHRGTPGVENGS